MKFNYRVARELFDCASAREGIEFTYKKQFMSRRDQLQKWQKEHVMSGIILLIVFAALIIWGVVASIVAIGHDGYRQSPTRLSGTSSVPNRY